MIEEELSKLNKEELIKLAINYFKVKEGVKRYQEANREKMLLASCRSTANRKNLEFNLTIEDIVIPEKCPLLGVPLTGTLGKGRQKYNASIDRINPTRGYIKGNVWVISDLANRMKQDATPEELIAFAYGILDVYDKNHSLSVAERVV